MSADNNIANNALGLRFSLAQQVGASRFTATGLPHKNQPKDESSPFSQALDPRSVLTSIGEVIYTWDLSSDTLTWGANAQELFGTVSSQLTSGRTFANFVEPSSGKSPHEVIMDSASKDQGTGVAYSTRYILKMGIEAIFSAEDTGRWFADSAGRPAKAHGALRLEKLSQEAFERLKSGDVSERGSFLDTMNAEISDTIKANRAIAIMVVGISDLNAVNDELGEEAGDEFIATVAKRMSSVMRKRDTIVRYAGNRHAFLLSNCSQKNIEKAASRILKVVSQTPIETTAGAISARVCIGAAIAPEHGTDAAQLLRRAEMALSATKDNSAKPFHLFEINAERDEKHKAKGAATHDIVSALNERRLVLALQPIVDARTRQLAFHEGLIRMRRPDGTIAGASEIVPAVERLGLVRLVDYRVLELAMEHLSKYPELHLSINVSPLTLNDGAWLDALAAHLGANQGVAERLIIEIVETAAIEDPRAMRAKLDCMKALGVKIGIDDFGAGHTSFRHLREFPIDILKIDGAFVQNLARSPDDRFFVRTLVDLAQHLGIATVGEWVESEETAQLLTEWGIDYLQGDAVGRPVIPVEEPLSVLNELSASTRLAR
jgi:diguanylate cyclase (GGDEF)-like protein